MVTLNTGLHRLKSKYSGLGPNSDSARGSKRKIGELDPEQSIPKRQSRQPKAESVKSAKKPYTPHIPKAFQQSYSVPGEKTDDQNEDKELWIDNNY
jgi:hypothetical protein